MDIVQTLLNGIISGIPVVMYGLVVFFITKSSISIFKLGVLFKSKLVTEDEISEFRTEIRTTMIGWKQDLSSQLMSTMESCLSSDRATIQRLSSENIVMRETLAKHDTEFATMLEKVRRIEKIGENMGSLDNKVLMLQQQINADGIETKRKVSSL